MKKKGKYDPKLVALARELAKHMKTESDISSLSQILTKLTVPLCQGSCHLLKKVSPLKVGHS